MAATRPAPAVSTQRALAIPCRALHKPCGAISQLSNAGLGLGSVGGGIVRGALSNAITQGIGVATGLQDRFDWTGVAVGSVVGGVAGGVGSLLTKAGVSGPSTSAGGIASRAASSDAEARNPNFAKGVQLASNGDNASLRGLLANGTATPQRNWFQRNISDPLGKAFDTYVAPPLGRVFNYVDRAVFKPVGQFIARTPGLAAASTALDDIVVTARSGNNSATATALAIRLSTQNRQLTALGAALSNSVSTAPSVSFSQRYNLGPPSWLSMRTDDYSFKGRSYTSMDDMARAGAPMFRAAPSAEAVAAAAARQQGWNQLGQIASSPFGGAAYAIANMAGASPARQQAALDLGSSLDGLLLAGAALKGGGVQPFMPGQTKLGVSRTNGLAQAEPPLVKMGNEFFIPYIGKESLFRAIRVDQATSLGTVDFSPGGNQRIWSNMLQKTPAIPFSSAPPDCRPLQGVLNSPAERAAMSMKSIRADCAPLMSMPHLG
jgi:hypothetical protein